MKTPALLAALVFALPVNSQETRPLVNMSKVKIVIENLDATFTNIVNREELESAVLVSIKRSLPQMTVISSAANVVYVNVVGIGTGAGPNGLAVHVDISIMRHVLVLTDDKIPTSPSSVMADVWTKGELLSGSRVNMSQRIRNTLDELLTLFAADYYRQNQ